METNTTMVQNNKLIAEFMGVPSYKINFEGKHLNFQNSKHNRYNTDWNMLMPVVEKINNLTNPKSSGETTLSTMKGDLRAYIGRVDIKSAYSQVVKIIKWHNDSQNQTQP